jgi:predicted small lipoprotein YifL
MRYLPTAFSLAFIAGLAACGTKGALYLPTATSSAIAPATTSSAANGNDSSHNVQGARA